MAWELKTGRTAAWSRVLDKSVEIEGMVFDKGHRVTVETPMLAIDTAAGRSAQCYASDSKEEIEAALAGKDPKKWQGGAAPADRGARTETFSVDFAPADSEVGRWACGGTIGTGKWAGGEVGPDGKIYGIPAECAEIVTVALPGETDGELIQRHNENLRQLHEARLRFEGRIRAARAARRAAGEKARQEDEPYIGMTDAEIAARPEVPEKLGVEVGVVHIASVSTTQLYGDAVHLKVREAVERLAAEAAGEDSEVEAPIHKENDDDTWIGLASTPEMFYSRVRHFANVYEHHDRKSDTFTYHFAPDRPLTQEQADYVAGYSLSRVKAKFAAAFDAGMQKRATQPDKPFDDSCKEPPAAAEAKVEGPTEVEETPRAKWRRRHRRQRRYVRRLIRKMKP